MEDLEVEVRSAKFVFGGNTYNKGNTFVVEGDREKWGSGFTSAVKRGNIIILGSVNRDKTVTVDMSATTTDPLFPDPYTTNVTGEDFPVEPGQMANVAGANPLATALKMGIARSTAAIPPTAKKLEEVVKTAAEEIVTEAAEEAAIIEEKIVKKTRAKKPAKTE